MNVNVHVSADTTTSQYIALSNFFRELSGTPASASAQPPVDSVEPDEPEVAVAPAETKPAVTRRRRTKAELEADEAASKVAAAGAEAATVAAEPVVTEPAVTTVEQPPADEFEKVAATTTTPTAGGKTFTEAEAQQLATVIARTKGPQVVKDKIAELGAVRIGDLTADQLNELGNYLEAQK